MLLYDICIAAASFGLVITTIPILLSKHAQSPRWISSVPIAALLTFMVPFFYLEGLDITATTIIGQAIVWWLIAVYRPVRHQT